ncbi:hypothetical protein BS17DRAFT_783974 [Gyrodon lividus]|nr:hypothetical protein BS17DRAFT_783974 [Gyrodon lividus]
MKENSKKDKPLIIFPPLMVIIHYLLFTAFLMATPVRTSTLPSSCRKASLIRDSGDPWVVVLCTAYKKVKHQR